MEFRAWRAAHCAPLRHFSIELLLREALTNSVVHGSKENPYGRVSGLLRAKPGRLVAAVWDEGEGFDWRAAWNREPDPDDTHGRGMDILKRYASSVRFNPKGNAVMMIRKFSEDND